MKMNLVMIKEEAGEITANKESVGPEPVSPGNDRTGEIRETREAWSYALPKR